MISFLARNKRIVTAIALVIAGILASVMASVTAGDAASLPGLWSARYEEPQKLPANWRDSLPEGSRFAAFSEHSAEAEAPLFSRSNRLTVIEAAGDASLLFLPNRLVHGGYPDAVNPRGCVIDAASAMELWGAVKPDGLAVNVGGVEYEAVGVIESARPLLLVGAEDSSDFAFTGVLFRGAAGDAFPRQALTGLLSALTAATPFIEETGLLADRLGFLAVLPLWLFCMYAARICMRYIPPLDSRRGLRTALTILAAVAAWLLLGVPNVVTPDMLPTAWADFSFWPGRLRDLLDRACEAWFLRGTMSGLLLTLELTLPVAAYSLSAVVAFGSASRIIRGMISYGRALRVRADGPMRLPTQ